MAEKSEGAFRTIREVADWLTVPTHVLRFWESKFQQIAPVKGAGGRRYYRPEDMRLLGGIKVLLHDQGLTIRGVSQKIDDQGVDPVMALSPDLDLGEQVTVRSRRVVRAGDDVEEAVGTPASAPRLNRGVADGGIRKDGAAPTGSTRPPDAEPLEPQPDADPMPEQPVDTDAPPQPGDDPVHDAPAPPQPVERRVAMSPSRSPPDRSVAARSDPEDDVGFDDEPVDPFEDEIGQLGDQFEDDFAHEEEPDGDGPGDGAGDEDLESDPRHAERPIATSRPPASAGARSQPAAALGSVERRRLKRVIRKLRGMIEDVEQELSTGAAG